MEKRLETLLTLALPYRERLTLKRSLYRGGDGPRVAVVAGIHGDELQGLYLCHRLAAWLEDLQQDQPGALLGQIELYPGVNAFGLETLNRLVPVYDIDLNRSFPGHPEGLLPQRIAAGLMAALEGAALVVDVHGSDIYLRELPQVRLDKPMAQSLLRFAVGLNLDLVWIHRSATVRETTLAHSLNARGVPCLVVEMGTAMRLDPVPVERLFTGLLNTWQELGVLAADLELPAPKGEPVVAGDEGVRLLHAPTSGLFVPQGNCRQVSAKELIGLIVSPFEGRILAEIHAPVTGVLFSQREYPLVHEGSLLARIVATVPS